MKKFDGVLWAVGRWSPDGKRVAIVADGHEKSEWKAAILPVSDPAGRNEKQVANLGFARGNMLLGWFPSKPPKKEESKDPGLVWLYDSASGLLEAYRPDGKKSKEWKLDCGERFNMARLKLWRERN